MTTTQNFTFIGDINPSEFKVVGYCFYHPMLDEADYSIFNEEDEHILDDVVRLVLDDKTRCNHCNHKIKYVVIVKHSDGSFYTFGTECANGVEAFSRGEFDGLKEKSLKAVKRAKKKNGIEAILDANEGLREAFTYEHKILSDMFGKLKKYGTLSEKQIAFALKLKEQEDARKVDIANRLDSNSAQVPNDRVRDMDMTIVSAKLVTEQGYGYCADDVTKLALLLQSNDGWKVWGKMNLPNARTIEDYPKDKVVKFSGTLTPKRDDPFFGFFKRGKVVMS